MKRKAGSLRSARFFGGAALLLCAGFGFLVLDYLLALLTGRSRPHDAAHRWATWWGRSLFHSMPGWRITIHGDENLPAENVPVIYVANHMSISDIMTVFASIPRQFRWFAKVETFQIPLIGASMRLAGYIPVRRGDKESHRRALELAATRIGENTSIFMFPEGGFGETPFCRPFKVGAFKLATELGVPIVPVCLKNTNILFPDSSAVPGAACVEVTILPSLWMQPGESLEAFATRTRNVIWNVWKDDDASPQPNSQTKHAA